MGFPQKKTSIHMDVHFQSTGMWPYVLGVVGSGSEPSDVGGDSRSNLRPGGLGPGGTRRRRATKKNFARVVDKGVTTVL